MAASFGTTAGPFEQTCQLVRCRTSINKQQRGDLHHKYVKQKRSYVIPAVRAAPSTQQPERGSSLRDEETYQEVALVEISGRNRRRYQTSSGEQEVSVSTNSEGGQELAGSLGDFIKGFVLPRGYPASVSDDYLGYQLRAVPAHITGWISRSLATSSLIHALGVGSVGPAGTVAATAAIKWITKDGIGAAGRFLVGGRLGYVFDEDPRRWRMIAVGFATVGLALEIATAAFPANFLALAGAGNFTKALGKGLSQPCFRIIQTHFAMNNNVGDISAKEEVWEVSAQLLGLATAVTLLHAIEAGGKPEAVLGVWVIVQNAMHKPGGRGAHQHTASELLPMTAPQVVHVWLRYLSLASLRFPHLNQKRACLLVSAHVAGRPIPDVREANEAEPMLADPSGLSPHVKLGVSIEDAFGGRAPAAAELRNLGGVYARERFWLLWRGGRGFALLCEDFVPADVLRLLWQGAWLKARGIQDADVGDLEASLLAMQHASSDFERQLRQKGWDEQESIFTPGSALIQRVHPKEGFAKS